MPIYNYECNSDDCTEGVFSQVEVIQKDSDPAPRCGRCGCSMRRLPVGASFAFVTKGGNLFNFSGAHGRVTHGSRKPFVVGRGHGVGGKKGRRNPTQADVQSGKATSNRIHLP